VAQFVGDNNAWHGKVAERRDDLCTVETADGQTFTAAAGDLQPGRAVAFFIRPEAIIIAPEADGNPYNRLTVVIKSILFDGANSRLLATPLDSDTEIMIALPQNRQYDYLKAGDRVEIGWNARSASCFEVS
jgi:spermidine/putrescine transport system ATP-binding protein